MTASYPKPDNNCTRGIQAWYSEGGERDAQLAHSHMDSMAWTPVSIGAHNGTRILDQSWQGMEALATRHASVDTHAASGCRG